MKVIIFNDTQNFNGSLNLINQRFSKKNKRFWNYQKYLPFLLEKVKSKGYFEDKKLELVKVYFYEGKYSNSLIKDLTWSCNQEISDLNRRIERENRLLNFISQERNISHEMRKRIRAHVEAIRAELETKKTEYNDYMFKQERNKGGQEEMFKQLEGNQLIELRTTPLKQAKGELYQKGVDVLLATELVHLAHENAYDLAVILSGDTDLVSAVKLIKKLGKKVVIVSHYVQDKPRMSNISDLMMHGRFLNLQDLTHEEIIAMSDLREAEPDVARAGN